jgi:cellulose synthase/poly-beta-1,6-N-acetylglucosamine synthase-like glycosyltransferase
MQYSDAPLVGLIASKNPVTALIQTVHSLLAGGCDSVIVVDDGSDNPESLRVFDAVDDVAHARVIHLSQNVGKAKALRAGFQELPAGCIVVQTDDDTLAGDLSGPVRLIRTQKADIVDIRVEVVKTRSFLGWIQELDYWFMNAVVKRLQDGIRARTWMSGASVMYTYHAGEVIIMEEKISMTEDTEGLNDARKHGFRVRFYARHAGQFLTMVPEDTRSLVKQWRRWCTGNGQVIRKHGLGAGNLRIATAHLMWWLALPASIFLEFTRGLTNVAMSFAACIVIGVIGAIRLRRLRLAAVGIFLPALAILWTVIAFAGLWFAWKIERARRQGDVFVGVWSSPPRTGTLVGASGRWQGGIFAAGEA